MARRNRVDIVKQKIEEDPSYEQFMQVLAKTDKKKPKAEDVEELRQILKTHPRFWRIVGDMAHLARMDLIGRMSGTPAVEELLRTGVSKILTDFGWGESPPLEQLLIDQVVICWLRMNWTEYKYNKEVTADSSIAHGDYWERRLSAVQRRYLRACETLARVRKVTASTVQVNIASEGGQQVNVAGS